MVTLEDSGLGELREQRAGLHEVIVALEQSAATPTAAPQWAVRLHDVLVEVGAAFERHIAVTEGPGGLFDGVLRTSPRLANGVDHLRSEHETVRVDISETLVAVRALARGDGSAESIRDRVVAILTALARHRQHGADLVYEAYAVDIGGGD